MKASETQAALRAMPVLLLIAGTALLIHCPKPNLPPGVPDPPSGITHGTIGTSYEFSAFAIAPDHNDVALRFAWGDGDTSDWSGFVPSGDTVTMSHAWADTGIYEVKAQARDETGAKSDWSEPHQVTIAVEPGPLKWRCAVDGRVPATPAIADDSTVYVGTTAGSLYAITRNGTVEWRYRTDGEVRSSPAVAADGTVYVGSNDAYLYALNPDGSLKWRYRTGGPVMSSPAIADDGTVYFGSDDDYLYALNPDGSLKWRYRTGDCVRSSPAVAADGTIYFGSDDCHVYALNPDGTLKWRFSWGGDPVGSSPAIAPDGTVYIGILESLCAFDPDGNLKWWYDDTCVVVISSFQKPAVAADGTVYLESFGPCLYALNPDGTLKWEYEVADGFSVSSSAAIAADGTVYFGTSGDRGRSGYLYALSGESPLADSPWPKFRGDSRNTGRARGR